MRKKQRISPALAIPYYTIPKLIRELKHAAAFGGGIGDCTIPKLIRELKHGTGRPWVESDYTIPKLIRELKLSLGVV